MSVLSFAEDFTRLVVRYTKAPSPNVKYSLDQSVQARMCTVVCETHKCRVCDKVLNKQTIIVLRFSMKSRKMLSCP